MGRVLSAGFEPASVPATGLSLHVSTALFLFADGSVRPVSVKTDVDIIRALATRNGGEVVSPDVY